MEFTSFPRFSVILHLKCARLLVGPLRRFVLATLWDVEVGGARFCWSVARRAERKQNPKGGAEAEPVGDGGGDAHRGFCKLQQQLMLQGGEIALGGGGLAELQKHASWRASKALPGRGTGARY